MFDYWITILSWEIIDRHRSNARKIRFDILIWGPSLQDKELYLIRIKIKDYLNGLGHSAKFSEELLNEGLDKSAPDPIIDEFFHADAAQIIIVLYRSRGTQTEFDRILKYDKFARKSLIFVEDELWDVLQTSLSQENWNSVKNQVQRIGTYNEQIIITIIKEFIDKLQFAEYLRKLELELLS
ncbi:MAG: hypothetical protein A2315_10710 [Ignavibacteria bacterium RIFOXYB2_FULL_35_12]|nr:MAG: hypothetical protein A2254_03165 [Ignavibacteria bacterium RIFOXYA2_FULL_35_9]OGU99266.1 MAG: hypothetical protein A2455_09690 [Ignavibacteria bacterium RIFOXYC2_FULL_35_16]OGV04037.1 MAG: hypothetical protein A2315_10710 [Ignavibacteria bacterium RIFOXYB2_FULL_35_12]